MSEPDDFERASRDRQPGLVWELFALLRHNKKWWLLPILIMLALAALLIFLAVVGVQMPFIYPL